MTINEALEVLRKKYGCFTKGVCIGDECRDCEYSTEYDAFTDALKTVLDAFGNRSELPNSSGDLISRQAAIDVIEDVETKRLKGDIGMIYAPAIKGLRALPPTQADSTDNAEFWRKRAKDYENMVINLTEEISKGAKIVSMEMNAEGLVFNMEEPSIQAEQKKEEWTAINKDDPATFPNECDWVWVTGKNNDVDIFQLSKKGYWIDRDQDYVADFDWVTAWMPFVFPDPYGGDDK